METAAKQYQQNKGGRPRKAIRMDQQLAVMCTLVERKLIEHKAKKSSCSTSEFLRNLALKGQAVRKTKVLAKEVLLFTATLNHLAASLNQIAKKRNRFEELDAIERAELNALSQQVKQLATNIKIYLQ